MNIAILLQDSTRQEIFLYLPHSPQNLIHRSIQTGRMNFCVRVRSANTIFRYQVPLQRRLTFTLVAIIFRTKDPSSTIHLRAVAFESIPMQSSDASQLEKMYCSAGPTKTR